MGDCFAGEEVKVVWGGPERRTGFSDAWGSALRASHFLLLRQKKVSKEKATPGSAPLRGSSRYSAGRAPQEYFLTMLLIAQGAPCKNSPAAQTRQADSPQPACVAQRLSRGPKSKPPPGLPLVRGRGKAGALKRDQFHFWPFFGVDRNRPLFPPLIKPDRLAPPPDKGEAGRGFAFPGPLRGAEQRRGAGGSRLALSEPQASLASRALSDAQHREEVLLGCPAFRVAQGTGVAGTDPGVAFSLATFFWPHKRKYVRQQGGTPCQPQRANSK